MIEHLTAKDFAPKKKILFVDTNNMLSLFKRMAFKANVILAGPKGIGKSLGVQAFASEDVCPIITFDCSEDIRRGHLIGTFIMKDDQSSPFVLGPITTAFQVANDFGKCILVLEEINALSPSMQKILNPLTDFRRRIEVPEAKTVFKLKPDAKLWVAATMNNSTYGGVYSLNEDLKSRFRIIPVEYPEPADEKNILKETILSRDVYFDNLPIELRKAGLDRDTFLDQMALLAHETRQKGMDYALSTRDVVQLLEDVSNLGLEAALFVATGKFEGDDRETFKKRVTSIFGVELDKFTLAKQK